MAKTVKKKQDGKDAMACIVSMLKANKKAEYGTIAQAAKKKGFKIYPIMFGRAKLLLGLVKAKPKSVKAASNGHAGHNGHVAKTKTKTGNGNGNGTSTLTNFMKEFEAIQSQNETMRQALAAIQQNIVSALG